MLWFFYFYLFITPLHYITEEKIPKGPTGINWANITMLMLLLWWFIGRSARSRPLLLPTWLNVIVVLMLGWNFLSLFIAQWTVPALPPALSMDNFYLRHWIGTVNSALVFWVAMTMLDSRRKILGALVTMALCSFLVFRSFYNQLVSVWSWHYDNAMRIRGPFIWLGSNELGAYFVYGAVFFGLILVAIRQRWIQGLFALVVAMYSYGILYSYSRASQLAFGFAAFLVALARYRTLLIVALLLFLTTPLWLAQSVRDRWNMTEDETGQLDESAQSRKDFWRYAWGFFLESPVTGKGMGTFKHLSQTGMDTHNVYMRILSEQGAPGFLLFMAMWFLILRMAWQLWRGGPEDFDRQYGFALLIATAALMLTNVFGDRFTHFVMIAHYWVLVGIGVRLHAHMRGVEALEDEVASPPAEPALVETAPAADAPETPRGPLSWILGAGTWGGTRQAALNIVGRPSTPPQIQVVKREPKFGKH